MIRKIFGGILSIGSILFILLYMVAFSMTPAELLTIGDIFILIDAILVLILGIWLFDIKGIVNNIKNGNSNKEQVLYEKELQKKQNRLERASVVQNDIIIDNDVVNASAKNKESFYYRVEEIFTAKEKRTFTGTIIYLSVACCILGVLIMLILLIPEHEDYVVNIAITIVFGGFLVGYIGMSTAGNDSNKAKTYGYALVEIMDVNKTNSMGKVLYYIGNTTTLATREAQTSLLGTKLHKMVESAEFEVQKQNRLNYYLNELRTEEFQKQVEREINYPTEEGLTGWEIASLKDAHIAGNGFYGVKISYILPRGVKGTCFLSRDFKEYKKIKTMIKTKS